MAPHIDLEELWRKACLRARRDLQDDEIELPETQESCPYTIQALVALEYDLSGLLALLGRSLAGTSDEA